MFVKLFRSEFKIELEYENKLTFFLNSHNSDEASNTNVNIKRRSSFWVHTKKSPNYKKSLLPFEFFTKLLLLMYELISKRFCITCFEILIWFRIIWSIIWFTTIRRQIIITMSHNFKEKWLLEIVLQCFLIIANYKSYQ